MLSVGLPAYRRRLYRACTQQEVAKLLEAAIYMYSDVYCVKYTFITPLLFINRRIDTKK